MNTIYTVYPAGWFEGRSRGGAGRAMQHACALAEPPTRDTHGLSFCGVYGVVSHEFVETKANVITCSRCVKAANALRAEADKHPPVAEFTPTDEQARAEGFTDAAEIAELRDEYVPVVKPDLDGYSGFAR